MTQQTRKMEDLRIKNDADGTSIPAVLFKPNARDKDTRCFLFFHGITTDKTEYLNFYEKLGTLLSGRNSYVLSIDSRAHGDSEAKTEEFTVTKLVSDAIASLRWIRTQLQFDQVTILGTSFGAVPALGVTKMYPRFVQRLFLLAPVLDFNALYLNPTTPERREKYKSLLDTVGYDAKPLPVSERISLVKDMVIEFSLVSLPQILASIEVPTEVMHGTADSIVPYQITRGLAEQYNTFKLHSFENMDHGYMDTDDEEGTSEASRRNFDRIVSILLQ